MLVEIAAQQLRHLRPQAEVRQHLRTTQVDVAIPQAHVLLHILVVQLERRSLGDVEHLQALDEHLHPPSRQALVHRALGARTHAPGQVDDVLVAQRFGEREHRRVVLIEHHLHQTLAIAQVNEDDTAVIAAPVYPAGQAHVLVEQPLVDLAAIVGAHVGVASVREGRGRAGRGRAMRR